MVLNIFRAGMDEREEFGGRANSSRFFSSHLSGTWSHKASLLPEVRLWQLATGYKIKPRVSTFTKALQYMLGFHGKMEAKEHGGKKKKDVEQ